MAEWQCVVCKAPPVDGTLVATVNENLRMGVCSALTCKTRAKVKIKLKSKVRGAGYAEAVGKTTFRRAHDDS